MSSQDERNQLLQDAYHGEEVNVLARNIGHWMPGRVVDRVHKGLLTVEFERDGEKYRKHLAPKSHYLSQLASSGKAVANAEDKSEAQKLASLLEALPLEPNTNFALVSSHAEAGSKFDKTKGAKVENKYMEDRHIVIDPWGPNNDMAFLAVYDGHGESPEAAEYAKANLHKVLSKYLRGLPDPTEVEFARAFEKTFREVDEVVCDMDCGTTATVAVLHRRGPDAPTRLHIANVGDSPAILFGASGRHLVVNASVEHNVGNNPKERARIQAAGCTLSNGKSHLFMGPEASYGIQVTRSLGDQDCKTSSSGLPALVATPHVFFHEFEGWETGLIIASDGVGEGFERFVDGPDGRPVEVTLVDSALEGFNERGLKDDFRKRVLSEKAQDMVTEARKFSADNMTAVVGYFRASQSRIQCSSETDSCEEQDPGYMMPRPQTNQRDRFGDSKACRPVAASEQQEYDTMWHRTVIQNDPKEGIRGGRCKIEQTFFATGSFLQVFKAEYNQGPRRGQPAVVKYFLAEGQAELKGTVPGDDLVLRRVYSSEAWSSEIASSAKAAEIITHFNVMMQKEHASKLVQVNLPEVWHGTITGETKLVEPLIDGEYLKFNSNSGWTDPEAGYDFVQALSHFSYDLTGGECLLCDLQGGRYNDRYIITDPVIISNTEGSWGDTDLGPKGIMTFFKNHKCSDWCKRVNGGMQRKPLWQEPEYIAPDCDAGMEKSTGRTKRNNQEPRRTHTSAKSRRGPHTTAKSNKFSGNCYPLTRYLSLMKGQSFNRSQAQPSRGLYPDFSNSEDEQEWCRRKGIPEYFSVDELVLCRDCTAYEVPFPEWKQGHVTSVCPLWVAPGHDWTPGGGYGVGRYWDRVRKYPSGDHQ